MIKDLAVGSFINSELFAVAKVTERKTKTGDSYKEVLLCDQSGEVSAKIWPTAINSCQIAQGKVAEITARVGEYQGKLDVSISTARTVDEANINDFLYQKPTIVFDIETVGLDFDGLGEWEQNYILHNLEKDTPEEEAKTKTGLCPLYGFVSTIGCYDIVSEKGRVLHLCEVKLSTPPNGAIIETFASEKDLLARFWEISAEYERFVTYNGRGFDFPYLVFRSIINRIKVPHRFLELDRNNHIDLQDQLKANGRGYKLEAITRAFGITNPKENGVTGLHVSNLYREGQHQEIVDYVSRDVMSTCELFSLWREIFSAD